jgi:integrase
LHSARMRAERKALEARDRGYDLSLQTVTVRELLEKYAQRCRAKALATKTLERYEELAECHLLPVIGALTLARLKPHHVGNVYAKAAEKGLSPKSVRHVHNLLHAALEWGVEQNLCFRNVADVAKRDLPKAQRSPAKALTEAEARRLLDAAVGTPWHAFSTLAFCTGARRAELAALRWSNVDLERATVTISESVVRTKSGLENSRAPKSAACGSYPSTDPRSRRFARIEQRRTRSDYAKAKSTRSVGSSLRTRLATHGIQVRSATPSTAQPVKWASRRRGSTTRAIARQPGFSRAA